MILSSEALSVPAPAGQSADSAQRVRALVEREYAFVWRFLRRLGLPEAQVDDAAQTVFARVLARADQITPGAERAYLLKAAYHFSFEARRAAKRAQSRRSELTLEELASPDEPPDAALSRSEDRRLLDCALRGMPKELCAVLVLFEIEGLTFSEIAESLSIPRGTVASRLRRARDAFQGAVQRLQRGGRP